MIIAIDFDGTIVDHRFPEIGDPVPGAINYIKGLIERGDKIILWTVRSGPTLSDAVKYLKDNGIQCWGICENPSQKFWAPGPKAYANIYIDDAAYGCPLMEVEGFHRLCVDWSKINI